MRGPVAALAKVRGSAPLDRIRFVWAVGFDPRTPPGVPHPPGSIGAIVDGSTAYLGYGPAPTEWVPLPDVGMLAATDYAALCAVAADRIAGARGLTQVSGTLGTPAAIYQIAGLACDTKGSFDLTFTLRGTIGGGALGSILPTVNGIAVSGPGWSPSGFVAQLGVAAHLVTDNDTARVHVRCEMPLSTLPVRVICFDNYSWLGGTTSQQASRIDVCVPPGEIVSVGVTVNNGWTFAAESAHTIVRRIAP